MSSEKHLPIHALSDAIVAASQTNRRFILQAPTGSGKSTQVPQILRDAGICSGTIVILQPRRIAARLLARRVAAERSCRLGEEVGYRVRHEGIASAATKILYVTEGLLLRWMQQDARLEGIGAILFDEFHERHIYGDVTLAQAYALQQAGREDLIIGVMSATMDVAPLEQYLAPCSCLHSEGRQYTVEVVNAHHPPTLRDRPVWDQAAWHCDQLIRAYPEGDILIFMPGSFEITRTLNALHEYSGPRGCALFPLHGELDPSSQDAAVDRNERRKIIVSTNVAETSLTIEGVRIVIDSGLARIPAYDPNRGINTLLVKKISQASSDQRAGRAGRTAPGVCLRLWSEREHMQRSAAESPEIHRIDLAEIALSLKAFGVNDLTAFPWFEPPQAKNLARALDLLVDLGAIDAPDGPLTEIGQQMAAFPLHPRYSRMLLSASEFGCLPVVALLVSFAQGRSFLLNLDDRKRRDERDELLIDASARTSDFLVLLRAWNLASSRNFDVGFCRSWGIHADIARQAGMAADQFMRVARAQNLNLESLNADDSILRKCLLSGFVDHLARRNDRGSLRCSLIHGRKGDIRRQSVVHDARLLVSAEIEERDVRGDVTVLLGMNTAIEEQWLAELFPKGFSQGTMVRYDPNRKRVISTDERRFRDLVLASQETDNPPLDEAARLLANEVIEGRLVLKQWNAAVEKWISRVNFLAHHCEELGFITIDSDARRLLIEQICYGAVSQSEIKDRQVDPIVRDWLSPELLPLMDQWAPEQITLPSGSRAKVRYEDTGVAILSATVQQLYGAPDRFPLANNRAAALVEILAPNRRPVQVTADLGGFWSTSYPDIKKQLRGRYPKHEWR